MVHKQPPVIPTDDGGYMAPIRHPVKTLVAGAVAGVTLAGMGLATGDVKQGVIAGVGAFVAATVFGYANTGKRPTNHSGAEDWEDYYRG